MRKKTLDLKAYMKSYLKNWRDNHKGYQQAWLIKNPNYMKKYQIRKQEVVKSLKEGKSCERCGYNEHWQILQFHHKDKKMKEREISSLTWHKELYIEEAKKCELLCPNCHWWHHLEENGGLNYK